MVAEATQGVVSHGPAWRQQAVPAAVLVAVAAGALGFVLWGPGPRPAVAAAPGDAPAKASLASLCERRLGEEAAPVQVLAFLPILAGCQDDIGWYLVRVAEAYPRLVSVRMFDMKSVSGQAEMTKLSLKCASVAVNGTTRFELPEPLGRVLLEGPMDPEEMRAVLVAELARTSGKPAPELPPAPEPKLGGRRAVDAPAAPPAGGQAP